SERSESSRRERGGGPREHQEEVDPEPMPLTPGARIGPYEIVASLGAGGMGEVYKAREARLDRVVAVKIVPPTLASDPAFREPSARERRTISQATHPNICTLYDVGEAPNPEPASGAAPGAPSSETVRFLVMEYLEGETLAMRLEHGAMKLD